jgi:proteasome lid subunit RPN8/RPN11
LIVQLQSHHVNLLKQETKRVHPVEACAMLFGDLTVNVAVVKDVTVAPNKLKSEVKFEVDPVDAVAAFAAAEKKGLEFIGLFHSHPAPAFPSSLDLEYMKLWGDSLWLIQSSVDNTLAAYQLIDGEVKQATINIK